MATRWAVGLLVVAHSVLAVPGAPPPACGGNLCYPILIGPTLRDISKDFCSYYLHYPRTTTVTVKTTATSTKTNTLPTSTASVTARTQATLTTTVITTSTAPGKAFTSTVTESTTAQPVNKRDPNPLWTPPNGSGDNYKPPALAGFPAAVVSAACSCIVSPTTVTVSSTYKASTTTTQTSSPPVVIKTVTTVTDTVTSSATASTTVVGADSTTTTTATATVTPQPPQTCSNDPAVAIRYVRGRISSDKAPVLATPSRIQSAEVCYTYCRDVRSPYPDDPTRAFSYTWRSDTAPGSPDGPTGQCTCYQSQLCSFFTQDPMGELFAGDTQAPF
ncbi:MAG: hypothetical protein Q9182_005557 [Xanthomendoza sp. 2 TL-2023]